MQGSDFSDKTLRENLKRQEYLSDVGFKMAEILFMKAKVINNLLLAYAAESWGFSL